MSKDYNMRDAMLDLKHGNPRIMSGINHQTGQVFMQLNYDDPINMGKRATTEIMYCHDLQEFVKIMNDEWDSKYSDCLGNSWNTEQFKKDKKWRRFDPSYGELIRSTSSCYLTLKRNGHDKLISEIEAEVEMLLPEADDLRDCILNPYSFSEGF